MRSLPRRLLRVVFAPGVLVFFASLASAVPTISSQPRDDTFVPGQVAGFRVVASGTGLLRYQWYRDNQPIAGATKDRHYTAAVHGADARSAYKVVVTDDTGSVTSTAAHIRLSAYRAGEVLPLPAAASAHYHLDAVNGSDAAGDGSAAKPYQTFAKVRPLLRGGELVVFAAGDYGNLSFNYTGGEITTPYTDWVTLMAAPGSTPRIGQFYAHGNWTNARVVWNGNFEFRLRLPGCLITDGVRIADADLTRIERCAIRRIGPWSGSEADIGKSAVAVRAARSITVEDCDITETAVGIGARGNDLVFRRNHIHEICHDGIQLTGCDQVLAEGNRIHNLDDGEDDVDPPVWNRHCDGLHLYPEADAVPVDANVGVTIRGNTIFHCEAMGIMFQNRGTKIHVSRDFVVENNVFGPSGGFSIHFKDYCHGFVFRHNSMLHVENDSFAGRYRTLACASSAVGLPTYAASSGVRIYNNIFHGQDTNWGWIDPLHAERFDHNLYHRWDAALAQGEAAIVTEQDPFADAATFDGALVSGSAAIDNGSAIDPVGIDLRGAARDARPDIGAYEFVPTSPYAAWAAAAGLTGAEALLSADPDGDGLANLLEYALGGSPLQPSTAPAPSVTLSDGAGAFSHRHSKTAAVTFAYETSTDLSTWASLVVTPSVVTGDVDGDGKVELLRVLAPISAGETRKFVRLVVTTAP